MRAVSQQTQRTTPKVSVAMITYNHEKYIAQAIESVLMQETNFQVELVIGEDCSTDGTGAIVRDYAERYPTLVRAFFSEQNLGIMRNYSAVFSACFGEYIAYLEGDDYWTDPAKLSRQVEMMEADPTLSFCFHRVVEFDESQGKEVGLFPVDNVRDFKEPVEELIRRNFIPSVSRLLRRSRIPSFDQGFEGLKLGDWPMSIMMAIDGKIGFLPQVMAVYRLHPASTWSSLGQAEREFATYQMFEYLFQRKLGSYRSSITKSALHFCRLTLEHCRFQGLRTNIPLLIISLKIAYRSTLRDIMAHVVWLFFYIMMPGKKGPWYDALCSAWRKVVNPPAGSR